MEQYGVGVHVHSHTTEHKEQQYRSMSLVVVGCCVLAVVWGLAASFVGWLAASFVRSFVRSVGNVDDSVCCGSLRPILILFPCVLARLVCLTNAPVK